MRRRTSIPMIALLLLAGSLALRGCATGTASFGDPRASDASYAGASNPSGGTDYHFSTSGNDRWSGKLPEPNADGSDGPWRSLNQIFLMSKEGSLRPGDRVLLRRGDSWNEPDHKAIIWLEGLEGTAEHPLTIGAYGVGERPVLSGVGVGGPHSIIRAQSIHHVRIQDLHLVGGANTTEFIWLRADTHESGTTHVEVLRCHFDNTVEDQTEGGTGIYLFNPYPQSAGRDSNLPHANPLHHIQVGWSVFHGIGGMPGTRPNKVDAINAGAPKGGHIWIHHNEFYWTADSAIDIGGESDHLIEHNKIIGISLFGGIKLHSQFSHLGNSTVRNNLIVGSDEWGMTIQAASGMRIFNNTIYSSSRKSLAAWFGKLITDQHGAFENNEIRNNIFWGVVRLPGAAGPRASMMNTFSNNIYFNPASSAVLVFANGDTIERNELAEKWLSSPRVTGDANKDPKLVNPYFRAWNDYGDFHLAPGSEAIDAGTEVGTTNDLDGRSVPFGAAPDIGAYEFVGPQ